jgi:cytochrome oxidase Cu insertion factor (SCO1/SenC/PrrC family)
MAKRRLAKAPQGRENRGTGSRWKIWVIAGILCVVTGGLVAMVLTQRGSNAAQSGPARAGRPAPDFTLKTFDGQSISLSTLKGKAVLVNFWAPT